MSSPWRFLNKSDVLPPAGFAKNRPPASRGGTAWCVAEGFCLLLWDIWCPVVLIRLICALALGQMEDVDGAASVATVASSCCKKVPQALPTVCNFISNRSYTLSRYSKVMQQSSLTRRKNLLSAPPRSHVGIRVLQYALTCNSSIPRSPADRIRSRPPFVSR